MQMALQRIPNLVSVVVPVYNRAPFINSCLNSLAQQSYKNLEVIIVNDGSTDETMRVIKGWKKNLKLPKSKKNRVLTVNLPCNVGVAGATHIGLFLARGEFIAMQDSDDLSHSERIQKQVRFLRQNPETSVVGSNYAYFPNGAFNQKKVARWLRYGEQIKETYKNGGHCVCHGTILFRGTVFDQLGGHTRKLEGAEDYEFIAKCISNDLEVENIPEVLYYYRSHKGQRSRVYYDK
jgi:glycosyltransferase involved in cell wall biosynthesis